MLHGYCIRRSGEPGPARALAGVGGAEVRLIEEGGLGLWLSECDRPQVSVERLQEHDSVIRHALRTATPLPIRYGAGEFTSEEAAREALISRAEEFSRSLDRIAGRVEMGVRVDWEVPTVDEPAPAPPPSAPEGGGRAYLEARRESLRARESTRRAAASVLDRVEREMGLHGVPASRSVLPRASTAGILAHLVRRGDLDLYGRAAAAAGRALPEYTITATGPWAPYSFT